MIATVTLNPSIDQHLTISKLVKDDAIRAQSAQWFAGGKGVNVSRVVKELRGHTAAFGLIGGLSGKMLVGWLDSARINNHFCEISGSTRVNTTITDLSDGTQTHIRTPGPKVTQRNLHCFLTHAVHFRPRPSYWVIGGSLPPGTPKDFYEKVIFRLEATGAQCVLDADDEALMEGLGATPFLIKPNEYEFERLTGVKPTSDARIVGASRDLVKRGVGVVVTTLGPKGAVVVSKDDVFRVNTPKVKVESKVGAGDSTIAGMLLSLERGESLREAARWGVAAGTAAVLTPGTTLCSRREVLRMHPKIKIQSL